MKNTSLIGQLRSALSVVEKIEDYNLQLERARLGIGASTDEGLQKEGAQILLWGGLIIGGILFAISAGIAAVSGVEDKSGNIYLAIGAVTLIIGYFISYKLYKSFDNLLVNKTEHSKEEFERLNMELDEYCEKNNAAGKTNFLPKEYMYSDAIRSFISYLENQRADTLKEAINLYEETLYREEMRNIQLQRGEEIRNMQNQLNSQADYMRSMEYDVNSAKRRAGVSTGLAVYNLIKRH